MAFLRLRTLIVLLLTASASSQQAVRLADASCGKCHAEIYRKYLATPMANASGNATDHLVPADFTHAPSQVHYKVFVDGNTARLSFSDPRHPGMAGERRLDYFLGSGHLGVTYLYTQEGYLLESPVAWYAAISGYDMKPGYENQSGMPAALPVEPGCLRCHMSGVAHTEAGTASRYAALPFTATGITCESCHSDTAAHVRSAGKAAVVNPSRLDPDRRDSVCISCHLEGDVKVERERHSAIDYHPGERISDYLSYFVQSSADPLSRGVSEVEQFASSRCKRVSGDSMSCTTCHDPHSSPALAGRASYYRAKCLVCHNSVRFVQEHHPENQDCTSCHMQRSPAQNIPHVAWTDHRILRQPGMRPPTPALLSLDATTNRTLTPIFSPQADASDAALAAYTTVMNGQSHDTAGTLASLNRLYTSGVRDTRVLEALGVLEGVSGHAEQSEKHLRELLAVEPLNTTALSNLGYFAATRGDTAAAITSWKIEFSRNQTDARLAHNLAAAQCAVGDKAGAQETNAVALRFSPGLQKLQNFNCLP